MQRNNDQLFTDLVEAIRKELATNVYNTDDEKYLQRCLQALVKEESLQKFFKSLGNLSSKVLTNSEAMARLLARETELVAKSLPRKFMLYALNTLINNSNEVSRNLLKILNVTPEESTKIICDALTPPSVDRLKFLEKKLSIPVTNILHQEFGRNINVTTQVFETLDLNIFKYLFVKKGIIPTTEQIGNYLDYLARKVENSVESTFQFNHSVRSEKQLAAYAHLCSLWHTSQDMKKMYSDIASLPLQEVPANYLFILFEDLALRFPQNVPSDRPFSVVQQLLIAEIARRHLPCDQLKEMAKIIAPAIMFYMCVSGSGYTEEERQNLLNNQELFNATHKYIDNITPLHLVICYRQFPLCRLIMDLGGDPDAICDREHFKTPTAKIRVDRPYFLELIAGMKGVTNSMRFSMLDEDGVLLIKLMEKIGGDIKQIHMDDNELLSWLQSGKYLSMNVFNFLSRCNDESYVKVTNLIKASDDNNLKEMINQADSYKRNGVMPEKLAVYLELQKKHGFCRPVMGGFNLFGMRQRNYDPGLAAFDLAQYKSPEPK